MLKNVFGKVLKSEHFWLYSFVATATVFSFVVLGSIAAYFILPSDILLIEYPMNQWVIFLLGNYGKDALLGFSLYYSYSNWRKLKEAKLNE